MAKRKNNSGNLYLKVILWILFLPFCLCWLLYKFTKKQLQENPERVWYKQTWGIILVLIFFFPIGVYLLWKYGKFQKKGKTIVTVCFSMLFLFNLIQVSKTNKEMKRVREYEHEMQSMQCETETEEIDDVLTPDEEAEKTDSVIESDIEQIITTNKETILQSGFSDTEIDSEKENIEVTTEGEVSAQNNLNAFLLELTPETTRDEITGLAERHGLFVDYKNTGVGVYRYRFARSKKVAKTIDPEHGSVITASFNSLHDNVLEEITYFDEKRMVSGFWKLDDGYSMIDYNNPQMIANNSSSQIVVDSFNDIVDYQPEISAKDNLLEELFISVSESTTKNDIIDYAKKHNLAYTFRGKGNENLIAYSEDVIRKYGNEGSYILFDYDTNEIITHLAYFEYPYQYKTGYSANYYSETYPYSELIGYYLYAYKKDPIQYLDARTLIDEVNKSREISESES